MKLQLKSFFKPADDVRVLLPVGSLLDLSTGNFRISPDGSSHLNGGLNKINGVGGRGNTFKSTVLRYMTTTAFGRLTQPTLEAILGYIIYDTEDSVQQLRVEHFCSRWAHLIDADLFKKGIISIVDSTTLGNEFFAQLKALGDEKIKVFKDKGLTAPFYDADDKPITIMNPTIVEVDSLSQMPVQVVESIYDKNEVGDSGMNVEAMRAAGAKAQMIKQMPRTTTSADIYIGLVAHMGDEIVMDQYAPSTKKLSFMKNGLKFKGVPENFNFLTNTLLVCSMVKPCTNPDKGPEYPRISSERNPSVDLMEITVQVLRCKTAASGNSIILLASQEDGIQPSLSELHNLRRTNKGYGLGGNKTTFHCVLYPEVNMTRTNAREKLKGDAKLERAINICSEIQQLHEYYSEQYEAVLIHPEELYEKIKALGYDWNKILETRGYWVFKEHESKMPTRELTSLDLLRMAAGVYTPKFADKLKS